jgi:hypothetical protein
MTRWLCGSDNLSIDWRITAPWTVGSVGSELASGSSVLVDLL